MRPARGCARCRSCPPRCGAPSRAREREAAGGAWLPDRRFHPKKARGREFEGAMGPAMTAEAAQAAEITARILLETKSVLFRPDQPFTFTSGRVSPVYVDCRRLISFPRARR